MSYSQNEELKSMAIKTPKTVKAGKPAKTDKIVKAVKIVKSEKAVKAVKPAQAVKINKTIRLINEDKPVKSFKIKARRLSKSVRKHNRRLKEAARHPDPAQNQPAKSARKPKASGSES
jgi:hypothetical protein